MGKFGLHKIGIITIAVVIIGIFVMNVLYIADTVSKGENIYQIDVKSYNSLENYTTKNYTIDSVNHCIKFTDIMGIKRVVCGDYSITQY